MSTPASILQGIQADQTAKADAWEAFNSAQSEADLTPKMMNLNIPQEAKAKLWELKRSMSSQKGSPITDRSTIGPQQQPQMNPLQRLTGQGALQNFVQTIKGYDQQGRAEHPILAKTGDVLSSIQELLMGGQAAGKPMGTSQGLNNSPVVAALTAAPGVANLGASIERGIPNLATNILRGPSGTEAVSVNPATIAARQLESRVPMAEPPGARAEMYEDRAQAILRRGKEQAELDAAHAQRLDEAQAARQKELADAERLRNQHAASIAKRGTQQDALDQAHAERLNAEVTARQKEVADIERLRTQHAIALNSRSDPASMIATPQAGTTISGANAVNRTLVSYQRPVLLQMVKDPSVPYQTKVMAIAELRRNPGNIPKDVIDSISKFMVEPGAPTRIYGGPGSEK